MNQRDQDEEQEQEEELEEGLECVYVGDGGGEASDEASGDEGEEEEFQYAIRPNKSQLKRDMQALQDLGDKLAGLKESKLGTFGFTERTLTAITECRRIPTGAARNRQLKYIAKRLAAEDTSSAMAHFDEMKVRQLAENRRFHQLELLRDRLVTEGDKALGELLDEHPELDRQQLRQMIRSGKKELETGKPVGAGRKLFRYLRDSMGK